ncbi:MAG: hypothetical protein LAP40_12545 [Acidobacteriia bacterium]|nr:hypothetical protein [Terriglobia bacterium]
MQDNSATKRMTAHADQGEVIAVTDQVAVFKGDVEVVPSRSLRGDLDRHLQVMETNYGEGGVSADDLAHRKLSKSGPRFCLPGLKGDEFVDELVGFIMHTQKTRALWPDSEAAGNSRPLCKSDDGIRGEGVPSGVCKDCTLGNFGPNDEPPVCKERLFLYIWCPDTRMVIVDLSRTSIADAEKFTKHVKRFAPLHQVPVKISATIVKRGMKEFSKAVFQVIGDPLSGEDARAAAAFSARLKQLLKSSVELSTTEVLAAAIDGEEV